MLLFKIKSQKNEKMMVNSFFSLVVLLQYLCLLHVVTDLHLSIFGTSTLGFSVDIIHRNSPESPFYDPTSTHFSDIHAVIHRSVAQAKKARHAAFLSSNSRRLPSTDLNMSAVLNRHESDYLMRLGFGKPRKMMVLFVDTGSDFTWLLCSVCKDCYKRKGFFKPKISSTYELVPCLSEACNLLDLHDPCDSADTPCNYHYAYADEAKVEGSLSKETIWFNSINNNKKKVQVPGILFGCTHHTQGEFNMGSVGIIGLSGHNLSLIRQLGPLIRNKFSYCLPSNESKSAQMYFGTAATVSGPGVVSTTMYLNGPDFFYNINLDTIDVVGPGERTVTIFLILEMHTVIRHSNSLISDSGTRMTYIENHAMDKLKVVLVDFISNPIVDIPKEGGNHFDFCIKWENPIILPKIIFKFQGGAAIVLNMMNAFMLFNRRRCVWP